MSKPKWEDAPEWAAYVAMDKDGVWYWYEHKPDVDDYQWDPKGGKAMQADCDDWRETLEQRP